MSAFLAQHFDDVIQMIAAGAAAVAAWLSYRQCKTMEKQLDGDRYLKQNEKSIELAELFANEIVPKSSYVTAIVHCSDAFSAVAKRIRQSEITQFTSEEFISIIGKSPKDAIEEIGEDFREESAREKILRARFEFHLSRPERAYPMPTPPDQESDKSDSDVATSEGDSAGEQYWEMFAIMSFREFTTTSNHLLNCLEHFCMALNSGVADDEILYPSLHQVFFSIVDSLYLFICNANSGNPTDRYYTHVVKLYQKWTKRHQLDQLLMKETEKEIYEKFEQKKKRQLR